VSERTGFGVLVIPELATQLITGGVPIAQLARTDRRAFLAVEEQMLLHVLDQRRRYRAIAQAMVAASGRSVVVFCDRGPMDVLPYVGRDAFEDILARNQLDYQDVRDSYDLVVHMVSTAVDIPQCYTTANNAARSETVEQAAAMDAKGIDAWTGAKLVVVGNDTDFQAKLARVEQAVLAAVAGPVPLTCERKFLLARAPELTAEPLASAPVFEMRTTYLRSRDAGVERSVRSRVHDGTETFTYYAKRPTGPGGQRERLSARISRAEYRRLLADSDPGRRPVAKARRVFVHDQLVFKLDTFSDRDLHILEAEVPLAGRSVTVPPFVDVERDVTGEPGWRNHALAAR
jgi:hypothetical protein